MFFDKLWWRLRFRWSFYWFRLFLGRSWLWFRRRLLDRCLDDRLGNCLQISYLFLRMEPGNDRCHGMDGKSTAERGKNLPARRSVVEQRSSSTFSLSIVFQLAGIHFDPLFPKCRHADSRLTLDLEGNFVETSRANLIQQPRHISVQSLSIAANKDLRFRIDRVDTP